MRVKRCLRRGAAASFGSSSVLVCARLRGVCLVAWCLATSSLQRCRARPCASSACTSSSVYGAVRPPRAAARACSCVRGSEASASWPGARLRLCCRARPCASCGMRVKRCLRRGEAASLGSSSVLVRGAPRRTTVVPGFPRRPAAERAQGTSERDSVNKRIVASEEGERSRERSPANLDTCADATWAGDTS